MSQCSRFNPRTRVGCDGKKYHRSSGPVRFNPRTRVGCDPTPFNLVTVIYSFNPRTRVGCDEVELLPGDYKFSVSIHAPA